MRIRLTIKLRLPRLRHLDSGALKLDLVIYYTLRSAKSPCRISQCFQVSIIITLDWNYVAKDKSSKLLTWITLAQHAIYCLDSPMWQFETEWGLQLLNLNMDYTKMLVRGHSVDSKNKGRWRSASSHNDNSVKKLLHHLNSDSHEPDNRWWWIFKNLSLVAYWVLFLCFYFANMLNPLHSSMS